jgi:hypothetical protein
MIRLAPGWATARKASDPRRSPTRHLHPVARADISEIRVRKGGILKIIRVFLFPELR